MRHQNPILSNRRRAFLVYLGLAIGLTEAAVGQARCRLDGSVSDAADDAPLAGAHVGVYSESGAVEAAGVTNSEGRFSVPAISCGLHILRVSFVGYATSTDTVLVTPESVPLRILLGAETERLQEIQVVAPLDAREGGQPRMAVDDEALRRNMPGTFAESLEHVAGVEAITIGVGMAKPVIRGLSMQRVAFVESGLKQEGQQWGADHGLEIDPFAAERVEITKGPATLRHGSDALGGVVELLPPPVPEEGILDVEVASIYKSNNSHVASTAVVEGRRGALFANARITLQDYGDYRVPADSFQYNGFVLPLVHGRLVNTAGRERNARIGVGFVRHRAVVRLTASRYSLQGGLFPGAVGIPRAYSVLDDGSRRNVGVPRQEVRHDKLFLQADVPAAGGAFTVEAGIQENRREEHSFPHAHNILSDSTDTVALTLRLTTASGRVEWEGPIHSLDYRIGITGQAQSNRRGGFEFLLPTFSSFAGGLYATVTADPTPRLTLGAGTRVDAAWHDLDAYADARGTVRATALQRRFGNVAASASVRFVPADLPRGWKFGMTLSKSFRIPAPVELSANGIHHGTFRHEVGDSMLRAEHGYQVDALAEKGDAHAGVSFSPFFYRFVDFIFLSPTARFSTLPDAGQIYAYAQADAVYAGGEISAQIRLLNPLTVRLSSAYVWNQNLETRLPLPFTPPVTARGEIEVPFPARRLVRSGYLVLGIDAFARQGRVARNEPPTPATLLLGIQAGATFDIAGRTLTVRLDLQNLLDQPYLAHLSRYRILNLPEQGRNVALSVQVNDLL